jgi:hypothetical protein
MRTTPSRLVESMKRMETFVPGGREDVARHRDDAAEHAALDEALADLPLDPGLGGDESGGHDDGGASGLAEGMDDVLEEQEVDGHLVLVLLRDVGDAGKEALLIRLRVELVAEVGEVELEGRIRDDVVEAAQGVAPSSSRW